MIGQWTSSGWCCCIKEIKSTTTYEEFHWQNPRIQTKINETKQPVKFSSKVSNTEESTTCWFSKYYALQEDQKSSFRFKAWYYQNGYRDESNQSEDQKAHKESEQKEKDKTKKLFHNADGSIDLFYLKVLHGQHPQSKSMHFNEWLEITKIRLEVDQYKIKIADSPLVDTSTFLATKYWEGKYSQETKEEPKGFEDCLTRWTPWTESERTISSSWSCWWKCCPINHWHWSTHCSTSTA